MDERSAPIKTPDINISSLSSVASGSSSATPTTSNRDPESYPSTPGESPPPSPSNKMSKLLYVEGTAESLAHAHNLSFPEDPLQSASKVSRRESSCGVFSVDLSKFFYLLMNTRLKITSLLLSV